MSISVNTNPAAVNAQRNLSNSQRSLASTLGKLSSGLRINAASDDAAGLAISERMKAEMRGLQQASRNAMDGISALQTADGAMNEVGSLLTRMRELSVQAANGTLGATDKTALQTEFSANAAEIDRIGGVTKFNGTALLDGTFSVALQVGTGTTANDSITVAQATAISQTGLGINGLDISTGAAAAMTALDTAINTVTSSRGTLGSVQNRLNVAINNLSTAYENTSAANSRIRDVDFAEETANMTKFQILSQAGVSVLSQANQLPASALKLIGG